MDTTRKALAATTLMATSFLSACTAGDDKPSPAAANQPIVNKDKWPNPTPTAGLAKGISLPLEPYMVSYADRVTIEAAENTLTSSCMKEYGFTVTLPKPGANPPPSDNDANIERRYGITDRDQATQHGYDFAPILKEHVEQNMPELTDVQVEVLTGHTKPEKPEPPKGTKAGEPYFAAPVSKPARAEHNGIKLKEGGCTGWAKKQVGMNEQDVYFVSDLNGQSLAASQDVTAVKNAVSDWSACMKKAGHDVATPWKAMEQGATQDNKPTKDTIALALADIGCKEQTNLIRLWAAEETTIQNKQIAANKAKLDGIKKDLGERITAAKTISTQ
ncbi:hypothetical protein ACIHJG_38450 [Streptomyces sp. NPDC052415]|uniref:hypothetical protein n=1 Tax=Streptomyces sp. NPDC052415 TaxID=3365690 RepID=UPI0037CF2FDC